jgi:2-polyprenyl-6-methoxyphenol hydroxylase-like FAD-dependent oxidoreductase
MSRLAPRSGRSNRDSSVVVGSRRVEPGISVVVTDDSNVLREPDASECDPHDEATVAVSKMDDVDATTAAIRERARAALLVACDGWRERGRCTAPDGTRVAHPHSACLAAQYRYELILLENGITR